MNFSIILPTLNEEGHIVELIEEIKKNFRRKKNKYEIIIVDDNSKDNTVKNIKNYIGKKNNNIKIISRKGKKNLASSIQLGINKAKYDYLIWLDADFQHPPKYIKNFFTHVGKNEVVIFSRFLKKSIRYFDNKKFDKENNENQSIMFNKICNMLFYKDITDYTSGYICIKKDKIKRYKLKGFYGEYFLDLIIFCKKSKLKIKELPFTENIRKTGDSKTIGGSIPRYIIICSNYAISIMVNLIKKFFL